MTTTLSRDAFETALAHQRKDAGDTARKCDSTGKLVFDRGDWVTEASCRSMDPDALFVRGAEQRKAAAICQRCPVLLECLADALDNHIEFGVWGGLTERQRRAVLRKNPDVTNWAEHLISGGEVAGL